jgi:hypothetical protein
MIHPTKDLIDLFLQLTNSEIIDKIIGIIYGCALGDCAGVQVEGYNLDRIKTYYTDGVIDMLGPMQSIRGIESGDWTDDTDQLILLMEVFTENKMQFSEQLFAKKLLNWKNHGFSELGDLAGMGLGQLTARAMSKDYFAVDPVKASKEAYIELGENRAPNGAVMRCGICAICPDWKTVSLRQAETTHTDTRSIYSSYLITRICRELLQGKISTYAELSDLRSQYLKSDKNLSEYNIYHKIYISSDKEGIENTLLQDLKLDEDDKMGYTLKTLGCGIYALQYISSAIYSETPLDFKKIILEIINRGGDTDTNAAVAGQVLGAHLGYSKLPKDWIAKLKHKEWLDKKIISLFDTINKV